MAFPAFSFSAAPFFGALISDRISVIGLKNLFGLSKISKSREGPTFLSKEFRKNYFACYSVIHFLIFGSWFCFSISPKCLVNVFYHFFHREHFLSFTSTNEILISNFYSWYCKNIHYIHYTQLTYRMRSKERNMANALRNYYLKQNFLRRSSLSRTTGVVVGIRRFRNFPACREKTKVVDLSGSYEQQK